MQLVDLDQGQKLRFLDVEFSCTKGWDSKRRVQLRKIQTSAKVIPKAEQERPPELPAKRRKWPRVARPALAGLAQFVKRRWLDGIMIGCGLGFLVSLYFFLFPALSREDPAPNMPAGFSVGEYRGSRNAEPVRYGLYVPPHFEKGKGPFPLIVFLHGYGERGIKGVFGAGLSQAIALKFGDQTPNGRFEFAAFFPTDEEGMWDLKPNEMENIIKALDHVMQRYRIDPKRVYLTGHSSGGDVWPWAEAYPERWAALAPVAGFSDPKDAAKVRHLPTWIFHGTKDAHAPAERPRALFQKLKDLKAEVRYTEIPERAHVIWREVYHRKDLYDWFASKSRQ